MSRTFPKISWVNVLFGLMFYVPVNSYGHVETDSSPNHTFSWASLTKQLTSISGAQWLSGRVPDSRPRGRGFEPHRRHCVMSLSKNINPSLVLVQPRKTCPFITERLLMGRKESNHTNK